MEFTKVELQAVRWSPLKSTPLCWFWMIQLILIGCANFKALASESVFLVWSSALNQSLKHYNLNSSHPSWSNVKENKMSQTNSQCRGLTNTSLKMRTCVTTFLDWELLRKSVFPNLRGPKKLFLTPKTLFGLRNPNFGGGGHNSKTFWFELWFWRYRWQNC